MARHKADWSELYPELLTSIAGGLETRDDILNFRAVCPKWRSSIPQIPQNLPILSPLFPHKLSIILPDDKSNRIIVCNTTFLIQPLRNPNPNPRFSKPWLITVEELNPGKLFLRKPLMRLAIKDLPENFPRNFELSDYSVREIRRDYHFRYAEKNVNMFSVWRWAAFTQKLLLFFNPNCANQRIDDCHAIFLHDNGRLLCVNLGDEQDYGYLSYRNVFCYDDVVNYKGKVWAIDRKCRVYVIQYGNDLGMCLFSKDGFPGYVNDRRKRLVESPDGLYLIYRVFYDELIKFRVYKRNEKEKKWEEVKSLDGRALFVCTDCCFFIPAGDVGGCGADCIFFPSDHFPAYHGSTYPDEFYFKEADKDCQVGVFRLEDGESDLIATHPGYSDLFWPPPKWLFPCTDWMDGEDNNEYSFEEICSYEENTYFTEDADFQATEEHLATNDQEEVQDVPWGDIPSDLLTQIAKHLKSRANVCRFRAVCKKWRDSCPLPLHSNLLCSLLPHKISTTIAPFLDVSSSARVRQTPILAASTVYLLRPCSQSFGSPKCWLITVEEMNPGKLYLRLPLRRATIKELPENFPRTLNPLDFHLSQLSVEYNFRCASNIHSWWSFSNIQRVVLFPDNAYNSTIGGTTALVLYDRGDLVSFQLGDEDWLSIRCGAVTKFDDVVNFKGKIYAIDRKGRVYLISPDASRVSRIVNDAVGTGSGQDRQKRLVESNGELYLLARDSPMDEIYFKVYVLNEEQNKWDEVKSLGDRILFVTTSHCFIASARDIPGWRGNCIIFPPNCLPSNCGSTHPDSRFFKRTIEELRIGVYHLGDNDGAKLIKSYPGYSDLFWPPPSWLQPLVCLSSNEPEPMDLCQSIEDDTASPSTFDLAAEGQVAEDSFTSAHEDNAGQNNPEENPTPNNTSAVQASEGQAFTANFQGIDVRSELLPMLQKIWAKYGNIAEQSVVDAPDKMAKALESVAEAVSILESTPGKSLDQSQSDVLCATFSDLQQMQFRVDWLAPFIEKASTCRKNNLLVDNLRDVESTKVQLLDMKRQLAEMERKVDGERRSIIRGINALGRMELEKCLGEGLF